jgi:hypothetical protein
MTTMEQAFRKAQDRTRTLASAAGVVIVAQFLRGLWERTPAGRLAARRERDNARRRAVREARREAQVTLRAAELAYRCAQADYAAVVTSRASYGVIERARYLRDVRVAALVRVQRLAGGTVRR